MAGKPRSKRKRRSITKTTPYRYYLLLAELALEHYWRSIPPTQSFLWWLKDKHGIVLPSRTWATYLRKLRDAKLIYKTEDGLEHLKILDDVDKRLT